MPDLGKYMNAGRISFGQALRIVLSRPFCRRFWVLRFSLRRDSCRSHQSPSRHRYQVGGRMAATVLRLAPHIS